MQQNPLCLAFSWRVVLFSLINPYRGHTACKALSYKLRIYASKKVKKQTRAFSTFLAFALVLTCGYECAWNSGNLQYFLCKGEAGT